MKRNTIFLSLIISLVVSLALVAKLAAAPLNPPTGAITATGPIQINQQFISSFPYTITQSGSYILTSNLTNTTTTVGIVISSSDVLLDLNGFTLSGANISTAISRYGIHVTSGQTNVRIVNGSLIGWEGMSNAGIRGFGSGTLTIENVSFSRNRNGLVTDMKTLLRDCVSIANTDNGYLNNGYGFYFNCVATDNVASGFKSGLRARFINCHTTGNAIGFRLANGDAAISRCTSSDDTTGFQQDGGSMFLGLRGTDNLAF